MKPLVLWLESPHFLPMTRKLYKYSMYQPSKSDPIGDGVYAVQVETIKWILDHGSSGWKPDGLLEFSEDGANEHLRKLNLASINDVVEDYKHLSAKAAEPVYPNPEALDGTYRRRDWCFKVWREYETLFEVSGWDIDVDIPAIFRFKPSPGYQTIQFGAEVVHLAPLQGQVIRILHLSYLKDIIALSTKEILDQLSESVFKTEAVKLSQIFDKKSAERTILIKEVRKGMYSLNIPPVV